MDELSDLSKKAGDDMIMNQSKFMDNYESVMKTFDSSTVEFSLHWQRNVINALKLLINSERSFMRKDFSECINITADLISNEAHVQELLKGSLPSYVSNVYNVSETRQLFNPSTYARMRDAIDSGFADVREAFLGMQYLKLQQCFEGIHDYSRSRRNLELALEVLGWDLLSDFMGSDRSVLYKLHPRPSWPFVENLSFVNLLDVNLLYGIMRVESGYDPTKISSAGACGLMQVMPQTARALSVELSDLEVQTYKLSLDPKDLNQWNCEKLSNPELNIRLSSIFLKQLQKKYSDSHVVIASYNAGETVVNRWLNRAKKSSKDFYSQVRFSETRRYIQKVLLAWLQYRSVYFGHGFTAQNVRYVNQ